jgi:membrane associated rhomboid family serine protease
MLILINVAVFFVYWLLGLLEREIRTYGMIPAFVIRGQKLGTFFTSMFLHADIFHLGFNMLYLYIFGDNVEDAFGHGLYFIAYLFFGVVASLVYIFTLHVSHNVIPWVRPTVGASGAISGVLGAYIVLYPKARILTLLPLGWVYIVPIPAVILLGLWFVYQLLHGLLSLGLNVVTPVAYWAHIGGFMAGLSFGSIWRMRRSERDF